MPLPFDPTLKDIAKDDPAAFVAEGRKEGQVQGMQRLLLRLGRKRFGEPNEATQQRLLAIKSVVRLERLSERVFEVRSWKEPLSQK